MSLFFVNKFKEKVDGRFKKEKPSTIALGSDRRGGKFDVTIFFMKNEHFSKLL
jgi:hypothetical protein